MQDEITRLWAAFEVAAQAAREAYRKWAEAVHKDRQAKGLMELTTNDREVHLNLGVLLLVPNPDTNRDKVSGFCQTDLRRAESSCADRAML